MDYIFKSDIPSDPARLIEVDLFLLSQMDSDFIHIILNWWIEHKNIGLGLGRINKSSTTPGLKMSKNDGQLLSFFHTFNQKCREMPNRDFSKEPIVISNYPGEYHSEAITFARFRLYQKLMKYRGSYTLLSCKKKDLYRSMTKPRGSSFIGVSKNGKSWQVTKIIGDKKFYICSILIAEVAAVINDIIDV